MGRHVFLRIVDAVSNYDPYFKQKIDAVGRKGLSHLQICTAAMRMLAYGVSVDTMGEARSFPGMMGSIDCMHWQWKNCPKAWKGMFMGGHKGVLTIILEAVASSDLWICHAFFGVAGSNNDINVLDRSPVFDDLLQDRALESRFAIVRGSARFWDRADLGSIMRACIIIHNMIVEDERDTYATQFGPLPTYDDTTDCLPEPNLGEEPFVPYETYVQNRVRLSVAKREEAVLSEALQMVQ
ncbi:hypothetical protein AgCh_001295 [Apium graveolens]